MIEFKKQVRRYALFILIVVVYLLVLVIAPDLGIRSASMSWDNLIEMLKVVPPIFVLLGLMDVWVPRETMIRLTGPGSGIKGVLLSFLLGSFAAGPLYAAFPVAAIMIRKGSKLSNVFILIGAWSTTKIPLLLFEASAMGWTFMLLRLALNLPLILVIAYLMEKSLPQSQIRMIYDKSGEMV